MLLVPCVTTIYTSDCLEQSNMSIHWNEMHHCIMKWKKREIKRICMVEGWGSEQFLKCLGAFYWNGDGTNQYGHHLYTTRCSLTHEANNLCGLRMKISKVFAIFGYFLFKDGLHHSIWSSPTYQMLLDTRNIKSVRNKYRFKTSVKCLSSKYCKANERQWLLFLFLSYLQVGLFDENTDTSFKICRVHILSCNFLQAFVGTCIKLINATMYYYTICMHSFFIYLVTSQTYY
jgi:hypothetical protein